MAKRFPRPLQHSLISNALLHIAVAQTAIFTWRDIW